MQAVEKRVSFSAALHDKADFLNLVMEQFNTLHMGNAVRLAFGRWSFPLGKAATTMKGRGVVAVSQRGALRSCGMLVLGSGLGGL